MKDFVARAMQIICLTESQIQDLHQIEEKRNYCLPNWNIQQYFKIDPIKNALGIPPDEQAQALHAQHIENDLIKNSYTKVSISDEDLLLATYKWNHSFDWMVYKNLKKINFHFQGAQSRGSLYSRVSTKKSFNRAEIGQD